MITGVEFKQTSDVFLIIMYLRSKGRIKQMVREITK